MSGRDHETDHDGECFKECKECRIKKLEQTILDYAKHSMLVNSVIIPRDGEGPLFHADGSTGVITIYLDGYVIIPKEQWDGIRVTEK